MRARPGPSVAAPTTPVAAHAQAIECQDGKEISLPKLFGALASRAAPALEGKPKIWLVQSCRKGERALLDARDAEAGGDSTSDTRRERVEDGPAPAWPRADGVERRGGSAGFTREHDTLWAYATTPGAPAFRGALFAAFRRVVEAHGPEASWLELLQLTNAELASWSDTERVFPSMDIRSTCRGAAFAPADLVAREGD